MLFWTGAGLALLSLAVMYGSFLREHAARSADPLQFTDDARIWLYPLERYHDAALFPNDYPGNYAKACTGIGYRAFYWLLSPFAGAIALSKIVPYLLLALTIGAIAIGAARFGRLAGAWMAAALCLSTDLFLRKLMGGLPRMFGFPIMACGAAALIHGRMQLLALVTCAGAALYPPAALPCGVALGAVLLLLPARDRGTAASWTLSKRVAVLALTASLSALLVLPTSLGLREYGRYIRPADARAYPETGPGGRFYTGADHTGYGSLLHGVSSEALQALLGAGRTWISLGGASQKSHGASSPREYVALTVLALAAVLFIRLLVKDPGARRMGVLLAASVVCHTIAAPAVPYFYLPQRYLSFPIPVLVVLMVSAAASTVPLAQGPWGGAWRRGIVTAVIGAVCLALVGGRGSASVGLDVHIDTQPGLYAFLATLPAEALIAGWPEGVMDNVPYVARRQAFITRQLHQPFHVGFAEEMRRRMRAFIDAYMGTDVGPLLRLRDEFGVTHLLVDLRHFQNPPPAYFRPFDEWTASAFAKGSAAGFVIPLQIRTAGVFKQGPYAVLDLGRIVPKDEIAWGR